MDYKINIAQLTWQVFGFPGYLPSLPGNPVEGKKFPELEPTLDVVDSDFQVLGSEGPKQVLKAQKPKQGILETEVKMGDSLLGQPLFDMLIFGEYNKDAEYQVSKELVLSDSPIVTVARKRTLVSTAIAGRKSGGTVKEFVSNDDYEITVNGILADKEDKMPWEGLRALNKFLGSDKCYKAYSRLFEALGINYVVVSGVKEIKPMEGYANLIQYSFTMLSDDAPEISL